MSFIADFIPKVSLFLLISIVIMLYANRSRLRVNTMTISIGFCSILIVETSVFFLQLFGITSDITILTYYFFTSFIAFLCFMLFFRNLSLNKKIQQILSLLSIFHILNALYVIATQYNMNDFPYPNHTISVILLSMVVLLFLYETFNSEKILQIKGYFPFWISIYIIIVFVGLLPILITSNANQNMVTRDFFIIMVNSITILGYCVVIIGLFLSKKNIK